MNKFDNKRTKGKDGKVPVDKRRISCLGIIMILFSFFSFFTFFGDKEVDKNKEENNDIKKIEDQKDVKENSNITDDNVQQIEKQPKDINENITPEIKDEVKNKVERFFSAYLANREDLNNRLNTICDVCTYDFYETLKEELSVDRLSKNANYHQRLVKDINIAEIEAINDGSIIANVKVTSEWIDKDKNHVDDETLEYNVQFLNEDGEWKIIEI